MDARSYDLYDGKICTGEEAAECRGCLGARMLSIGYELVIDRGDPREAAWRGARNDYQRPDGEGPPDPEERKLR